MNDLEIGRWSIKKFGGTTADQYRKLKEEQEELMFELADVWIVTCGVVARGSKRKFPTYEEFCKQYSVKPDVLRQYINKKLKIDSKSRYVNVNGVLKRVKI